MQKNETEIRDAEFDMHARNMKLEMMRTLSATAAFASGVSLGVGAVIVGVIALLQ